MLTSCMCTQQQSQAHQPITGPLSQSHRYTSQSHRHISQSQARSANHRHTSQSQAPSANHTGTPANHRPVSPSHRYIRQSQLYVANQSQNLPDTIITIAGTSATNHRHISHKSKAHQPQITGPPLATIICMPSTSHSCCGLGRGYRNWY